MLKNIKEPLLFPPNKPIFFLEYLSDDLNKLFPFLNSSFKINSVISLISMTFLIFFLNFAIYLLLFLTFNGESLDFSIPVKVLIDFGANVPFLIRKGELWRVFTANFLHLNFFHLFSNMSILLIIGSGMEKVIGKVNFLIVYISSGVIGFILSSLNYKFTSVGASGAVLGIMAIYLSYFLLNYREISEFPFVKFCFWIFIITLFASNIIFELIYWDVFDHFNHLGGFSNGFLLGNIILKPYVLSERKRKLKFFSCILFLFLFISNFILIIFLLILLKSNSKSTPHPFFSLL